MAPGEAVDAMTVARTAADGLRTAWDAARAAVAAAEARLGGGPMGQAFMAAYGPGAPAVVGMVDTGVEVLRRFADAGTASARDYVGADGAGRAAFDRIR